MNCIFCNNTPPDVQLTEEHVFPEALGSHFSINSVCKACNDKLGSYVDTLLTENFLIRMIRFGFRIPSKSGRVLSPLTDGQVDGHPGLVGSFKLSDQENVGTVNVRPIVERVTDEDGHQIVKIIGSAEDADRIVNTLRERSARDGKKIRIVEEWSKTLEKPQVIKESQIDPTDIIRPILKIAYELGTYWIGQRYTSDQTALHIREAVISGTLNEIEASIGYFPPQSLFARWPIPSYFHAATIFIENSRIWFALRIFNVIESIVLLSEEPNCYPSLIARRLLVNPLNKWHEDAVITTPLHLPSQLRLNTQIVWEHIADTKNTFRVTVSLDGIETVSMAELLGVSL